MSWYALATTIITGVGLAAGIGYATDFTRLSIKARRYGHRGWWQSELGWVLFLFPTALTAIFAFIFLSRMFGDSLIRRIIGLALYSLLVLMLPWKWRIMRKSQAKVGRDDEDTEEIHSGGLA